MKSVLLGLILILMVSACDSQICESSYDPEIGEKLFTACVNTQAAANGGEWGITACKSNAKEVATKETCKDK